MNRTDLRILKQYKKGLSLERIARKIGRPGDIDRVREALERNGVKVDNWVCVRCGVGYTGDCMLTTGVCVFCHYRIDEWDSNGQLITKEESHRSYLDIKKQFEKKQSFEEVEKELEEFNNTEEAKRQDEELL